MERLGELRGSKRPRLGSRGSLSDESTWADVTRWPAPFTSPGHGNHHLAAVVMPVPTPPSTMSNTQDFGLPALESG